MMKKIFLLFLFMPMFVYSQGWEKTYGGTGIDIGYCIQQTKDEGYIITGSTETFAIGSSDVLLLKTDKFGNESWWKTYGSTGQDRGNSVQETSDGGYIIAGTINNNNYDIFLIKTDINGDTIWTKTFGGIDMDFGTGVQQTIDSGFIIVGYTFSFGNGVCDTYLIKTDNSGNTLWTKFYGGVNFESGFDVQQTADTGYIIVGNTYSSGNGGSDVYLIKTDSYGDTLWTRTYGGANEDFGYSVKQTSDEGYIICGTTDSFGNEYSDIYLIKTDDTGNLLWDKTFGGIDNDYGQEVQATADGGYIVVGSSFSYYGNTVYMLKTDSNGNQEWDKTFGGNNEAIGSSVKETIDDGFIITGSIINNGNNNVYLIKTDEEGIVIFTTEIPSPNSQRKLIKTIDISGKEIAKPRKNQAYIEIYDDGSTEKKVIMK